MDILNFKSSDALLLSDKYWESCIVDSLQRIQDAASKGERSCLIYNTHPIIIQELKEKGFKVDMNYTGTSLYIRW